MTTSLVIVSLFVTMLLADAWQVPPAGQAANVKAPMDTVVVRIGAKTFVATLRDNPTAKAFRALLPMSIVMKELNGNEKLFRLPSMLPTQESVPPAIQAGDLMLYGSSTLVLFYESFSTPYSYTNIGRVDDPTGLKAALGSGEVTVAFEVAPQKR
jgi:hypothetical protein